MLNKGTVMEAYRDRAVIMNERCEFIKIRTKNILVPGENIEYSTKDIITEKNLLTRNLSIAASFIICFITAAFIFQYVYLGRVYAYVGLDINPSLEIAVNSRNLVAAAKAFDEEGLKLTQEYNFSKTPLETALKEILAQSLEHEYLHGDNPNVIGVSLCVAETNGSGDLLTKIEETIKEVLAENNVESTIFIFRIDKQTREEAVKNNVSPIRYFLWTKAKEQGLTLPIDEVSLTNPRDFNNACLLSDKITYQSSQEESSASEVITEESLPLGKAAGLDEEIPIQLNGGLPPAEQDSQAVGELHDTQNGKINEAGSPYQQPDGSSQMDQAVPGDNTSDKQGGTDGSTGNGSVDNGVDVTEQGSNGDNSSGSTNTSGGTSGGGSTSTSGSTGSGSGSSGGGASGGGSTSSSGGGGTGRSGSGGR